MAWTMPQMPWTVRYVINDLCKRIKLNCVIGWHSYTFSFKNCYSLFLATVAPLLGLKSFCSIQPCTVCAALSCLLQLKIKETHFCCMLLQKVKEKVNRDSNVVILWNLNCEVYEKKKKKTFTVWVLFFCLADIKI